MRAKGEQVFDVRGSRLRVRLIGSAALLALCASAAQAQIADLAIPSQPLSESLMDVAKKTGESIIFSQQALNGIQAPVLNGHMSARRAVEILIKGTDLEIVTVGNDGLVIRPVLDKRSDLPKSLTQLAERTAIFDVPRDDFQGSTPRPSLIDSGDVRFAQAAPEQAPAPQNQGGVTETVEVSASRINVAGYDQPTPVTVVSAAQLQQNAYANIADSVRQLPQVSSPPASFSTSQALSTAGTAGSNFVNLRALGVQRTLVLLDSQRVVASSLISTGFGAGAVDINTFPQALISRVDVVTGGASAAWGSDAVAGVVNFVLDKNYTGFKGTIQGSDTTDGLDRGLYGNAVWGGDIDGGRGHVELSVSANILPDTVLVTQEKWFKGSYFVSNPAYTAGNGQPQLIVANNVGLANASVGGLIVSSPAGVAGPGVIPAAANALRGIQFGANGTPEPVNFGNVTQNTLSNGGTLTDTNSEAPWSTIAQPSKTYTFFGYGSYKLTDAIQASIQLNYSDYTGKSEGLGDLQTAATIQSGNPFIPASVQAAMTAGGIRSFTMGILNSNNYNNIGATGANFFSQAEGSLGPAVAFNNRNLMRGVFTLDGAIGDDWSWNAYWEHSEVRNGAHWLSDPIVANLTAAEDAVTVTSSNVGTSGLQLGSVACRSTLTGAAVTVSGVTAQPGCVPLDVFGTGVASSAAIRYVTGLSNGTPNYDHQTLEQDAAEASMQGTLPWQLPAGNVAVAFGAGYRKEAGKIATNPIAARNGYFQGSFLPFPSRDYYVYEGFGEVDAPILKDSVVNSLNFNMAGRVTDYSTSGLVETWKLGATSQVNDDIKLRTTWSVDIRAPQLYDLYSRGLVSTKTERDPNTQATVLVNEILGGNPNLFPEVARTVSGGIVLTPTFIPGLSLSADWYHINLTGEIGTLTDTTILSACNASLPSLVHPGQNGNPHDPLCSLLVFGGANGTLSQINLTEINIASQTVSGLDLQATYTMDFWGGSLTWSSVDSYNDENTLCNPGSGCNDFAGDSGAASGGAPIGGPKWRGIVAAIYNGGPYSFTVQSRWYGTNVSYQNGNTGNQATAATANLYDPAHFEVPAIAYLDLRASYNWSDNIQMFGAIDNVQNLPPPLVAPISSNIQFGSNSFYDTNQNVYDMLGRTIRVGIRFNY